MGTQKPSIPKGTRDFLPEEMIRRKYIFQVIEKIYQRFGFRPIETPAMEQMTTLTGKYGDEGDKLLFRVLNSGDFLAKGDREAIAGLDSQKLAPSISEKGLRYDLTVPFARFVVQHRNELAFPFRRYQIQPVWRADRPQKGRYREFFQCDADVIGSDSLISEAELVKIIGEVFGELGVRVQVRINNRKILAGIAEYIGAPELLTSITIALDKLDKIGEEKVIEELLRIGLNQDQCKQLSGIIDFSGIVRVELSRLEDTVGKTATGRKGLDEMRTLMGYLDALGIDDELWAFWLPLARGLDYYTGTIIEVVALDHEIGSICGGGRYDDLTGIFGLDGVSGVGVSFGADRIYDVLEALGGFPEVAENQTRVLFVNFGGDDEKESLRWLRQVREAGVPAEIFPDAAKLKKQMGYANSLAIPFVVLIGEEERRQAKATVKNMNSGEQESLGLDELLNLLSK